MKKIKNNDLLVFSGNSNRHLAEKICEHLGISLAQAAVERFNDGEIRVKIESNIRGKDVFLVQSTCHPVNENIVELLIMLDALRRASPRRLTAVVPYYGYARQDRKDQPRVPITAKLIANVITVAGADRVLTMDLHAGQIQGFFDIPLDHLYAVKVFVEYFEKMKINDKVGVSPDVGGIKTARFYANRLKAPLGVVDKRRVTDTATEVMNILGPVAGKNVIVVDDLVATAGSITEAASALKKAGAKKVFVAVTHPVLSGPAIARISKAPIEKLLVTDTIPLEKEKKIDKIKVLSVAGLFAEAINNIHSEESVSSLFEW